MDEKSKDNLPENFDSVEEAAEFWESHDLADFWDETHEVEIEVRAPQRQWIPLASELAQKAAEQARREGISVETLVNLWVAEKLQVGT
jgi:hypothetical protein